MAKGGTAAAASGGRGICPRGVAARGKLGDFVAKVKVTGGYNNLYDQAGLMIRIDSSEWIKTGIEYVKGIINISSVFTHTFSDWSVIALDTPPKEVWLRLVRKGDSVELSYSTNGLSWALQRLGYFPPDVKVQIGVMAAAPVGYGFPVTFEELEISAR